MADRRAARDVHCRQPAWQGDGQRQGQGGDTGQQPEAAGAAQPGQDPQRQQGGQQALAKGLQSHEQAGQPLGGGLTDDQRHRRPEQQAFAKAGEGAQAEQRQITAGLGAGQVGGDRQQRRRPQYGWQPQARAQGLTGDHAQAQGDDLAHGHQAEAVEAGPATGEQLAEQQRLQAEDEQRQGTQQQRGLDLARRSGRGDGHGVYLRRAASNHGFPPAAGPDERPRRRRAGRAGVGGWRSAPPTRAGG